MISEEEKAKYFDRARRYDEKRIDKLLNSSVVFIGCGAINTTLATWLARAGVGSMVLIDGDVLEEHNLERYEGLTLDDVGKFKVDTLSQYLLKIRPWMNILSYPCHLDELVSKCFEIDWSSEGCSRFLAAAEEADLMIVGVDNNWARYWATWLAIEYEIPYLEVGFNSEGYIGIWFFENPRQGPCRLCAFTREDYGTDLIGYNLVTTCPFTGKCLKVSGWKRGEKVFVYVCGSDESVEAERVYDNGKITKIKFKCPACSNYHEVSTPETPAPSVIEVVKKGCAEALETAIDYLVREEPPPWNLKLVKGDWRETILIRVHESHQDFHACFWRRCSET